MWDEFYDYMDKAEGMDPLRAMILLTKACMNYMGVYHLHSLCKLSEIKNIIILF